MNLVAWMIIACEIAFWIVMIAGLLTRYVLGWKKLGFALLAMTPLIDLILLAATTVDLYRGASATMAHGLAAVYIGVSLVFGKSMIAWADEKFRRYALKENVTTAKRHGFEFARHYFRGWIKHVLAYAIGVGILFGLLWFIDDPSRTDKLAATLRIWTAVLAIDLIISISYFIWPKRAET